MICFVVVTESMLSAPSLFATSVGYHCNSPPASRQFMRKNINEANAPPAWKFKNNKPTDFSFPSHLTAGSQFIQKIDTQKGTFLPCSSCQKVI